MARGGRTAAFGVFLFHPLLRRIFIIAVLVLLPAVRPAAAGGALASTFTVTTGSDSGPGSLREAIALAGPGDSIAFAGDYTIPIDSQLTISTSLTVDGSGHTITLDGQASTRVLYVASGINVTLNSLQIVNGSAGGYAGYIGDGGGIYNDGVLTLANSAVSYNAASEGAGIFNRGTLIVVHGDISRNQAITTSGYWGMVGGGIYNAGTLTLSASQVSENQAAAGGGILNAGALTIEASTFMGNSAGSYRGAGMGAGIYNDGAMSITNSTFTGNVAAASTYPWITCGVGGAIYSSGGMVITNSTLLNNAARSYTAPSGCQGQGGGISAVGSLIRNTIVANSNDGGNCSGIFAAGSKNDLSTDNTCGAGFTQTSTVALDLLPLSGTPGYFPISLLSVAVDRGSNDACPTIDEAGDPRPQDGDGDGIAVCDVGAYETPHGRVYRQLLPYVPH